MNRSARKESCFSQYGCTVNQSDKESANTTGFSTFGLFIQEFILMQLQEDVLRNLCLFLGGSAPELVERNVEPLVGLSVDFVELVTLSPVVSPKWFVRKRDQHGKS